MPRMFKVGNYVVYFWVNENDPLEPVHVHIAEAKPVSSGTKVWITKYGGCLLANNKSGIPPKKLRYIMEVIAARSDEIVLRWKDTFGTVTYYC